MFFFRGSLCYKMILQVKGGPMPTTSAVAVAAAPTSGPSSDVGVDSYADDTFEDFNDDDDDGEDSSLKPPNQGEYDFLSDPYPQAAWGNSTAEAYAAEELGEEEQLLRWEVEQRIRILDSVSTISR
jgi:hypothetical protein